MRELVKEWFLEKGTLDGVKEHFPFIKDEDIEHVKNLITSANGVVLKSMNSLTEYDKIVMVYANYIIHENKAGFWVEDGDDTTRHTVGEYAYIKKIDESYELDKEIKDVILKCTTLEYLGVQFVEDPYIDDPYICGDKFYVKRILSKSQIDKLPREAFKHATNLQYYMTPAKRKSICAAMSCFMEDSGDQYFTYLANLTRQTGLPVKDIYEAMGFQFVSRIDLYDKYDVYIVLANQGDSILVKSHKLSKPITMNSVDKLFLALVKRNVEELEAVI